MAEQQQRKAMSSSERQALIRIVKGRIKVLREAQDEREHELRAVIFNRIVKEHEEAAKAAASEVVPLIRRAEALKAEFAKVVKKHKRNGVQPGTAKVERYTYRKQRGGETYDEVQVRAYSEELFSFAVNNQWRPTGITGAVEQELADLKREKGLGSLALSTLEQNLIEEILVGGLSSGDSQTFLAKVPTLDSLPTIEDARRRELTS